MSAKVELEWFLTSEKAHPDEIEGCPKDSIPCLVQRDYGGVEMLHWNPFHDVWDDYENDDVECEVDGVVAWAVIPDLPVDGRRK